MIWSSWSLPLWWLYMVEAVDVSDCCDGKKMTDVR